MVGVNTLCPFLSRRSDTRRQHQPPCQAPCTSTKVLRWPPGRPIRCGGSVRFHSSSSPPAHETCNSTWVSQPRIEHLVVAGLNIASQPSGLVKNLETLADLSSRGTG